MKQGQGSPLVKSDMILLIAFDFILWILDAGMVDVAHVFRVHPHSRLPGRRFRAGTSVGHNGSAME